LLMLGSDGLRNMRPPARRSTLTWANKRTMRWL
jgi:hypothetical protein